MTRIKDLAIWAVLVTVSVFAVVLALRVCDRSTSAKGRPFANKQTIEPHQSTGMELDGGVIKSGIYTPNEERK